MPEQEPNPRLTIEQLRKALDAMREESPGEFESLRAKEILNQLKKTSLWDGERKQWNMAMDADGKLKDSTRFSYDQLSGVLLIGSTRFSSDQLLGVLAEAITGNISEAKEMFAKLKKTSLWDGERKQWRASMDAEDELQNSARFSSSQLLGVLAEAFYEKPEQFRDFILSFSK